ncbi:MAG: phosphohydrolase [Actinobacteria bacterium HGW-Actinobacteria-8]|nr:MAG: phosphohydrolase [Actinobacteria bacterium HGW-Actinobacteria-8]
MISRDEAYGMVKERIPQQNLVYHCVATEIIMEALAQRMGLSADDVQRWALAGLLHDLDYAQTADDPASHGKVSAELLEGVLDDETIHAILAHARHAERETTMDHALWCADPTTGFIVAAALVRPEKDLSGVAVKSLKKRWKEGAFAKGANREQMAGHEQLGLEREEFLAISLEAMQKRAGEIGF